MRCVLRFCFDSSLQGSEFEINLSARGTASFTVKKLECLKQAIAVNTLAWNNKIGLVAILLVCTTSND